MEQIFSSGDHAVRNLTMIHHEPSFWDTIEIQPECCPGGDHGYS